MMDMGEGGRGGSEGYRVGVVVIVEVSVLVVRG